MTGLLALLLHVPLMLGAAFGLATLSAWVGARIEGRAGASPLQLWHDWRRLLRKRPLRPESASPFSAVAPLICLAILALAALLVPSFSLGMTTAPMADLIVIAGLLAASRVVAALALLDAGSAPGAIVAIGVLRPGLLAEPALLMIALILALLTGSTNLTTALAALHDLPIAATPTLLLLAGLAGLVLANEEGEVPDSLSGWHLASAEAVVALRRVVWLSLLAALLIPSSLALPGFDAVPWLVAIVAWVAKILVLGAVLAVAGPVLRGVLPRPGMPVLGGALLLVLLGLLFLLAEGEFA